MEEQRVAASRRLDDSAKDGSRRNLLGGIFCRKYGASRKIHIIGGERCGRTPKPSLFTEHERISGPKDLAMWNI